MDPITHALVGGMVAKTLKTHHRRFWMMVVLGEVPDLDVFAGSLGPWSYWLQHRGITHSFFGVSVQALFFALVLSKWDPGPFRQRLWHYSIPLLLHALCDFCTSYGVPLFSPFSYREFSGDLMPAITVVPLVFMLVGLYYVHTTKIEGWHATKPLWFAWGVYFIFSFSIRAFAYRLTGPLPPPVKMVSGLIDPTTWTAVVAEGNCCRYRSYWINTLHREKRAGGLVVTDMDDPFIAASLKSPEIKLFVNSIRWSVARKTPIEGGGYTVEWGKMLYSSRGVVRGLWAVDVAADGTVSNPRRTFSFWDPTPN